MKKIPIKLMCTTAIALLPTIIIDFKEKRMLLAFLCFALFINDND